MTPNKNLTTILRFATYVLLAATLFVPLFVANSMFFPFITGKAYAFRVLVEAAFAIWLVLGLFDKNARPKISPLSIGVTLFAIIALIADLAGVNPIRSLWSNYERSEGWIVVIHLWAYFVVMASVLRNRIHWQRFFNVSFIAAFVVAVYATVQFGTAMVAHNAAPRLDARLGNAEYLAVYMLIHAFIALYMTATAWTKKQARGVLYIALFAIYSLVLVGTQTRGTILALAGALCIVLAIIAIKKDNTLTGDQQKSAGIIRIVAGSLLGLIILGSLGFYSARNSNFVQSHGVLQRMASISLENPRIQYIWPMAIKGFNEKPILGWGQENFNYVFNKYYDPKMWGQEQWFDRAHNVFLDWLIAGGVIGFLFYVSLYVLSLVAIWRSRFTVMERAVLTGLVAGYAIHNIFVFDNLASYLMFFVTLGFLHAASTEDEVKRKTSKLTAWSDKIAAVVINPDVTEWIVAPVVVILLAGGIYFFNYRPVAANLSLIKGLTSCAYIGQQGAPTPNAAYFTNALAIDVYVANQETREQLYSCSGQVLSAQTVPDATKLAFYKATTAAIAAQASSTPNDLRGYLFGASFYDNLGQYSFGKPLAERAYAISPQKQSVLLELASNEIGLGSTTPALVLIKKAYESATDNPTTKIAYARGLYLTKDYAGAISIMKEVVAADQTNLQNHITLAMFYMGNKDRENAISELNEVASSSIQYAPAVDKAVKDIKAGKNPFAPEVTGATTAQ